MLNRVVLPAMVLLACASLLRPASAAPLLYDTFGTGDLSTSAGPGGGFAPGGGAGNTTAYESGGVAVVGGGSGADENIYSLSTFDPTGSTLTWQIASAPTGASDSGASMGWTQAGTYTCAGCGPEIYLEVRGDRVRFGVGDSNGWYEYFDFSDLPSTGADAVYNGVAPPLTMQMTLTATTWSIDITGDGTDVEQSGDWISGFALSDVLSAAGGALSTFGGNRSDFGETGTFSLAEIDGGTLIASAPEPASVLLLGLSLASTIVVSRRRGKRPAGAAAILT